MYLQCQPATQSHLKICKVGHPNSLDPAAHPAICHDAANHHVSLHLKTSAVHVVKAPCRSMAGMEKARMYLWSAMLVQRCSHAPCC